jgi:hypothetical protein
VSAPFLLRIVLVVTCVGIGSVVVRHITLALQGQPVPRQIAE